MEKPYKLSGIYGGPQYETVAALGSMLLNTDPATIAKAHELCNRHGIDTISTGVCIAWAMECWERGIDLGRPLPWGDAETIFLESRAGFHTCLQRGGYGKPPYGVSRQELG